MGKQVVAYERFSPRPKTGRECESIEVQRERVEAFCRAQDWTVAAHYEDRLKSGGSMKGRTGLDAALAHVCRIRGVLVVYSMSRLVRDIGDGEAILKRLKRHKVGLAAVTEIISTTTAWGRATLRLKMVFDQLEREQTAERTSDSMKHHQANGRRMGRVDRAPFGWRAVNGSGLEEDALEQAAITQITALHAEGRSLRAICAALDADGINRRGRTWAGAQRLVSAIVARAGKAS